MGGSEGKWTPRPWRLHQVERFTVVSKAGESILHCDAKYRDDIENAANTALCMAAPDLLIGARNMEKALTDIQELLAEWIVPDSGISDHDVLSQILGITDHRHVLGLQTECRDAIQRAEEI